MAEYFTSEHFNLLNTWPGNKRDESIPEQNRAYEDLKQAYEVTEHWAKEVQERLFPDGYFTVHKRPTSQANIFLPYNWANIFPQKSAPKELAYTVGIDAHAGFIVKIDTVGFDDSQEVRKKYLSLRGDRDGQSPIIAILPAADGLSKSLNELVDWSIEAIKRFGMSYEKVARQLGLITTDDLASILAHFRGHPDFIKWQPKWGNENTSLFFRFVSAVHGAGLDLWLTGARVGHIRFGRKDKEWKEGKLLGWITLRKNSFSFWWKVISKLSAIDETIANVDMVKKMEKFTIPSKDRKKIELFSDSNRSQIFWPDDYNMMELEDEDHEVTMERKAFNKIYYGPPGTGKTYNLQTLFADYGNRYDFITFHQSYSYEEFIEGIRPVIDDLEGTENGIAYGR